MQVQYVIIGAGAIGGTLGAHMIQAGHDVLLVDAAADHVQAINDRGLTIRGFSGTFTVKARATTPDKVEGPLAAVILATKSQATEAVVTSIKDLLAPDGFIVSLQNGLNELTISKVVGPERTVGCFINFSSDYLEPGLIHYAGPGAFVLGELNGEITDRIKGLQVAFSSLFAVKLTDNIFGYLWGKLAYGSMLKLQALTNDSMADAIDRNRELMVNTAREVLKVARTLGVSPLGFDGFEPDLFLTDDWAAIHRSLDRIVELRRKDQKTHSGVWRDIAVRKRKTETEAQLTPVLAEADRLGVAMPRIRALISVMREVEEGLRPQRAENLLDIPR